jgi:hypothetical protein
VDVKEKEGVVRGKVKEAKGVGKKVGKKKSVKKKKGKKG